MLLSPTSTVNVARRKTAYHAAEFGNLDSLKALIDKSFNGKSTVDDQDERGFTVLAWAARNGHQHVVTYLIEEKNSNIEKPSFGGFRPLHHACNKMHEKIVRSLLRAGADVHAVDDNGDSALHISAARGVLNIVVLLLENNAEPTKINQQGVTPVHKAAIFGQTAVIKRFAEIANKNVILSLTDNRGDTPLHYASKGGHISAVKLLLELGADSSKTNLAGQTSKDVALNATISSLFA